MLAPGFVVCETRVTYYYMTFNGIIDDDEIREALSTTFGRWFGYSGENGFGDWVNLHFADERDALFAKMRWPELTLRERERATHWGQSRWNAYNEGYK